jgi:hypothetical protein
MRPMPELNAQFIAKTQADLEDLVETAQRKATLDIWQQLTRSTPVDTGRARASWIATTRTPSGAVPPDGKDSYGLTNPRVANTKIGVPNFIVSNLVYMPRLNQGHSLQASPLFVERAIAKGFKRAKAMVAREIKRAGF